MLFKKRYPELDLLRASAIILVLFRHFYDRVFQNLPDSAFKHFFAFGWHGVDLFFVLSGFLIGGQIIEEYQSGAFSFKSFYIKRFFRIFPAYYSALVIVVVATSITSGSFVLENGVLFRDFIYHLFYVQNYLNPDHLQGGIYWSLAIEEQFYLLAPFFIVLFLRRSGAALLRSLVILVSFEFILRFFIFNPSISWWASIGTPFHTRLDMLVFGVLAAYVFIRHKVRLERLSIWGRTLMLSSSALFIGLVYAYGKPAESLFNSVAQFTLAGLGFGMLILYLAVFPLNMGLPLRKASEAVAKYSYTIYLYHVLVLSVLFKPAMELFKINTSSLTNFLLIFPLFFGAVFCISAGLYRLIEKPGMELRKRLIERRRAPITSAS